MKTYCVYVMSNRSNGVLYIGVTGNLIRRIQEHRRGMIAGFSCKYKTHKLIYYETTTSVYAAICREKKLKRWKRQWKIKLIEIKNPFWKDLYPDFNGKDPASSAG